MVDSDSEYVADDLSDDDIAAHQVSSNTHGTRSTGPVRGPAGSTTRGGDKESGSNRRRAAWEDIQRSWDTVVEGADGSINSTVEGLREAGKRKRSVVTCVDIPLPLLTGVQNPARHYTTAKRHHSASHSDSGSLVRHD